MCRANIDAQNMPHMQQLAGAAQLHLAPVQGQLQVRQCWQIFNAHSIDIFKEVINKDIWSIFKGKNYK